ncbi:MAG: ribonuclease J [Leptospiraceae bacterium]|nr:ribonuclease J [Leptospiraceae bacterium]
MALAQPAADRFSFSPAVRRILQETDIFVAFAGGVGNFGTNFAWFKEKDTILWLDVGSGFPHGNTPGLSKVLPDLRFISYAPPTAIVITHGHEDHIGALVHLLNFIPEKTPLYASPFTLALLRNKFEDFGYSLDFFELFPLRENTTFSVGGFTLQNFFMPHSIPQTFSVGIYSHKSKKKIYFTSDFKLSGYERRFRQKDIERYGPVDFLFIDSTGAMQAGLTDPEEIVLRNLEEIVAQWPGRIFVTTFSSQIERIHFLYKIAQKYHRKFGLLGYSLKVNLKAAYEANEFPVPFDAISQPSPTEDRAIWVVAGCQAEKGSSLQRLAEKDLEKLKLRRGDLFLYSASMIPGNEEKIYMVLNKIATEGVTVLGVSTSDPKIHTSGHGRQEDMGQLISWLRPKYIIPVHGDPLRFNSFRRFLDEENRQKVHLAFQGHIYALKDKFEEVAHNDYSPTFLDGLSIHQDISLYEDRERLSEHGLCLLIFNSSRKLIKVCYEAVSSTEFLQEVHPYLEFQIRTILAQYNPNNERSRKELLQRLNEIHEKRLGKTPHVVFVELS